MNVLQQLEDTKEVVNDVLQMAKKLGATQAEASMSKVQGISVGSRLKELETLEFTNDGGLGITVYHGKHKGSASTADLSKEALQQAVSKAVEIARHTSEDPCTGLADEELMAKEFSDLELYHPTELDPEYAIKQVIESEESAFDCDSRITNSDGASYSANMGFRVYGNTHGLIAGYPSSRYSLSCVVIAQEGDDMQRDYSYTINRSEGNLKSAVQVGKEAAELTLGRLGARKLPTTKVPVIFHHDVANSLFSHFVSAISGGSLYRNSSFLLDHLGKQVFPEWCCIEEKPHLKGGLASSVFDSEGVATQDMTIVDGGHLQHYLLTSYSARKLGYKSNGHAGGIHNWLVKSSGENYDELLARMGTGLLVTELMGQGVNIVNGDYSRGAAGFWVENGKIQYPVHEITIAGNLKDMFMGIQAIGNDTDVRGAVQTGSILIDEMQVAGN
ncbi:metalloprotease PmbA [Alteromonadaceae bacterium M269]|nr:metalloprotease PmbA [Alteromonadaceae bacterium M269]